MAVFENRIGVVLLQLGGPDRLESVEPFLYNLFSDPDIIDLPLAFLLQKPLARLISSRRAPKVQEIYQRIGKRSPILKLTLRQASALERTLRRSLNVRVFVAMRYWHPLTDAVLEELRQESIRRVILLPLYPQYSKSTTGSSINEWMRGAARWKENELRVDVIGEYCDHPMYVQSIVKRIAVALNRVPLAERKRVHLLFSAHGTPMKLVRGGDPNNGREAENCV